MLRRMSSPTLHLRFESWDDRQGAYLPVPDGSRVRVMDEDLFTRDDVLAEDFTRAGRVTLDLPLGDEARPDLFFVVDQPDGARWDTRARVAVDGTPGLLDDFRRRPLGLPQRPVVFRRSLDIHVSLRRWDPKQGWVPVPEGLALEALEHDRWGDPKAVGYGHTDADGRSVLQIFDPGEAAPDLSLRVYGGAAHGLPDPWSSESRGQLRDPGQDGHFADVRLASLGTPEHPLLFGLGAEEARQFAGNAVEPVIDGVELLAAVEEACRTAKHSLHIEMMLFFDDPVGRHVTEHIVAAARRGIDVRLMIDVKTTRNIHQLVLAERMWTRFLRVMDDAEREAQLARYDAWAPAEKARGEVDSLLEILHSAPNLTLLDTSYDLVELGVSLPAGMPDRYQRMERALPWLTTARVDHRKLLVVDGRWALLGGQNIGQEYLYARPFDPSLPAEEEEWAKWHDCFVSIRGPAVRELQLMFRERWVAEGGDEFPVMLADESSPEHGLFPTLPRHADGVPVRVLRTTPGVAHHFHLHFMAALQGAQREILIETPYFSSPEVRYALEQAAQRGVRVVLILPDEHNDSIDFHYAARLVYLELIGVGVEVYEYQNHMNHSKVAIVDDVSFIGSANLNHSSFYKHYEVVVAIDDAAFTARFRQRQFEVDLEHSRRIHGTEVEGLLDIRLAAKLYLENVVWRLA